MDDSTQDFQEPANLRFLRRLVTILTLTMIFGLLTVIGLLVMRFSTSTVEPALSSIELPNGTIATAYTRGPDWYAIVTKDNQILIYNLSDNTLRQTITIQPK